MGVVNAALELTGGTLAKEEKLTFSGFGTFCLFYGKGPYPIASKGIGANAILSTGGNIAMKRFAVAVVFVVLLAMAASGAVQDFGEFTLDIPKGWTVKENKTAEESIFMDIIKNDKSSSMSVSYEINEEYPVEDLIQDWANMEQTATEPERTRDGFYTFTFKNNKGKKVTACGRQITRTDGERGGAYLYVEMTGKDVKTMTAIRDSFALK